MSTLADRLLEWYARHGRSLPWRGHPDPYAVWVSEVMLQQTQVATVIPYFTRWMARFPTIQALAEASEQDVLASWEGLGYYSRARHLQRAAQVVMARHQGRLPEEMQALRRLPGIGRYTAAAIVSIAFGQDEATLDGNLRRVFARLFDVAIPADTAAGQAALWELAQRHLPRGRAGDYNQALMDLGAAICQPRRPDCPHCPLQLDCAARARGVQEARPVLTPRRPVPTRTKLAAVIVQAGRVLLIRRPARGLLGGLWEFPAGESGSDAPEALPQAVRSAYDLSVTPLALLATVRHAYTHFKLVETAYLARLDAPAVPPDSAWVPLEELGMHPMGKVDRRIASHLAAGQ